MGQVFLAEDQVLGRKVALKFLSDTVREDAEARERLLREARSAAALDDPFICKVYETGDADGEPFIAMEYVEGESLKDALDRGELSLQDVVAIAVEIAEALEVAHDHGIIHRDLKPGNIMLTPQGHAKVLDFGLAKLFAATGEIDREGATEALDQITRTGVTLGTLAYMSPEQLRGEPLHASSDVFSFGVVLYEMISGRHPFMCPSQAESIKATLQDPPFPIDPEVTKLPAGLTAIIDKALTKDPSQRYQNAGELVADLREVSQGLAVTRPRVPAAALVAGAIGLAVAIVGGVWLGLRPTASGPEAVPPKLSILIADFDNRTGDDVFSGVLEEATGISLESAPFIVSKKRGKARQEAKLIRADATRLDEEMARLVAQRDGINAVITGTIASQGKGYEITLAAVDSATGKALATQRGDAGGKDEVLGTVGKLAGRIRRSLGDTSPASRGIAERETFTAASLEAAHAYAQAQELVAGGQFQDAVSAYQKAVKLDPDLGRAYAGMAVATANMGQTEKAIEYYELAMKHIDRMTEREKYRTRSTYYLTCRDYDKAAEVLSELTQTFPYDENGLINLPLAYFQARKMDRAVDAARHAVEVYPSSTIARANLALLAVYAGDFKTGLEQSTSLLESHPSYEPLHVCRAVSELAEGDGQAAAESYRKLEGVSPWGASLAATGLADLALYEGRAGDAVRILQKAAQADVDNDDPASAAIKLVTLGEAEQMLGRSEEAAAAARRAVGLSEQQRVLFGAAQVLIEAGRDGEAGDLAKRLGERVAAEPQVYALLLEGELALHRDDPRRAVELFRQAQGRLDTWLGRFDLGRAYVAVGAFPEAHAELEAALKRRGEATAVFLDDIPTYHHLPPLYYYLGRAQEGLGSPAAADSYRTFLEIRGHADSDPMAADAQMRLSALQSSPTGRSSQV